MKKVFTFLIGIIMCLSLCACENEVDRQIDNIKKANEDYKEAHDELERLHDELEFVRWKIGYLKGDNP